MSTAVLALADDIQRQLGRRGGGGGGLKKKATQISKCFFWQLWKIFRDFFNRVFFNSPCYETPKE
jgi:hypothetical protein